SLEGRLTEAQEERVHALADLQVRLQSYFEQKLREESERERQKYLELLARLKGEVESSLARMVDSSRFDSSLREKIGRSLETFRAETQRTLDSRLATAGQQLKVDQTDLSERLARLDQALEERRSEIKILEETARTEIDDLDRRTQILSDRLVPVVRKTWLRVAELQQGGGTSAESEVQLNQLRRELNREIHRLDTELMERSVELRDRMEAAISNQGRVWLTLIRQLSQLTGDRRAEIGAAAGSVGRDEMDRLESLPALYADVGGADLEEDPVNPLDPDPDAPMARAAAPERSRDDPAGRKRFRRSPR
ncbi:MAG TPA: hypothetical protein VIZ68_03910, partial [Thermoplasmata archaeon]